MGRQTIYLGHRRRDCPQPESGSLAAAVGGEGTKGARLHDWAYLELADLDAAEFDGTQSGLWTRGLLIRRTIADGDGVLHRLAARQAHAWLPKRNCNANVPGEDASPDG